METVEEDKPKVHANGTVPKVHMETMREDEPMKRADGTVRGMVVGTREVVKRRSPCVVFVGNRVDWILTAQLLGFDPEVVYFRQNNPLIPLIQRLLPRADIMVGAWQTILQRRKLPPVAFVHGHVGAFAFLFDRVDVILSTQGKRGAIPGGWRLAKARTSHVAVRGVTDAVDHCFLWTWGSPQESILEVSVPQCARRDVYSVASDTVAGQPWPKPDRVRLRTPIVLELEPGVYHGGGLLSVDHPTGHYVLRSVFNPSKWCRRRLPQKEVATAFDVPY
jgi:hypothetical protein